MGGDSVSLPALVVESAGVPVEATINLGRIADDLAGAGQRAARSKSTNTLRAYTGAWAVFERYCLERSCSALPAHPATVAAFLDWRSLLPVSQYVGDPLHAPSLSTVTTAFSAIAHYHHAAGIASPTDHPQVQAVLEGITRDLGKLARHPKVPVLIDDLLKLAAAHQEDMSLAWKRDWAVLLVGFASSLRRSNIAALTVEDIEFLPRGIHLLVRKEKVDQHGEGRLVGILRRPILCPVRTLEAWIQAAGITTGPVFRGLTKWQTPRKSAMSPATVDVIVKTHMGALGYVVSAYGAHSLRSGFATEAAAKGRTLKQIMDQGGWTEPKTAQKYMRKATLFDNNPTDILP